MHDKSITIAVPTYRNIPSQFFGSFLALYEYTKTKYKVNVLNIDNTYVDTARNSIIAAFLKNPSDLLFFMDSDMLVPRNSIELLDAHDKPVVSGIYFGRSQAGETYPVAYNKQDEKRYAPITSFPKSLIEVDAVGLGCCLIKKSVLIDLSQKLGEKPFFMVDHSDKQNVVGEDMYFCRQLKENGYPVLIDPALQCGHIGGVIDTKYYLANRRA